MNVLDVAQNSVAAGAKLVQITLEATRRAVFYRLSLKMTAGE